MGGQLLVPIIQTNSGYGYVYKSETKRKKSFPPFFKFLLWTSIIIGTIIIGVWLSSKISNLVGINNNLLVKTRQFYCVDAGIFDDYSTALALSETIKKQGGAGYIYQQNGYHVMLSAYPEKSSATKVIENLSQESVNANLCIITLDGVSIKTDENNTKDISNALNMFYNCFDRLYNLSLDYDSNTVSKSECINTIEQLKQEVEQSQKNLSTNDGQAMLVYLKLFLGDLADELINLQNCTDNFKGQIKATYFKSIELYASFRQEIGK